MLVESQEPFQTFSDIGDAWCSLFGCSVTISGCLLFFHSFLRKMLSVCSVASIVLRREK